MDSNPSAKPARPSGAPTSGQFFRYAVAGVTTNTLAYLLYLWLTNFGLDPKAAATICFLFGVAAGFALNRQLAFSDRRRIRSTFPRYVTAYAVAYAVNIGGLYLFTDHLKYPHEVVQVIFIVLLACGLFLAQKFWVFSRVLPHETTLGS